MCNSKRKSSIQLQIIQCMCQFFSFENKINFFLNRGSSSTDIFCNCLFELFKSIRCIVKILDRLMQSLCRIIRKESLKMSKSYCTLIEIIIILHCIIAGRTFYKEIYSPVFSCRIYKIRKAIITFYQSKRLSLRISAILDDLFTKPGSNAADILHQFYRFLKNTLTHSLQNITFCSLWCLVGQSVCIINMSTSISDTFFQFTRQFKSINCFVHFITDLHLCFLPQFLRIQPLIFQILNCSHYHWFIFFVSNSIPFIFGF